VGTEYTRALAVDLLEEIAPSVLFGPHGNNVIRVLTAGLTLDEDTAHRLAAARRPTADREYGKAWFRWLAEQPNAAPHRDRSCVILAVAGDGPSSSPIGKGFLAVSEVVHTSARLHSRATAFGVEEDGEVSPKDPWRTALSALLDASMALGAPHLVDSHATTVLTAAWNEVFEPTD
jgi:hypothetical protein